MSIPSARDSSLAKLPLPGGLEVASFYHLPERPVNDSSCGGLACFVARHLRGPRRSGPWPPAPSVYCLGQCYGAPAARLTKQRPHMEVFSSVPIVLERIQHGPVRQLAEYRGVGGYTALESALARPPADIIGEIEQSSLRGRGGAGFPTGRKWRALSAAGGAIKHVVANADEGDAGAFSDRFLMEDDPFALIEGMTIAAYATGASRGWIYLRAEYPWAADVLRSAVAEARAAGLLGANILGHAFSFDISIVIGQGSYVCGEETALLRSVEGRRPEAQARPPQPTERGLFGQPTVVQNVETLATVPWIVRHGGRAYHALGFSRSRGTKAISLNSLFARPGLYEVEFGLTVRRLVEEIGGGLRDGQLRGVIIGGPLAGVIPPALLDTPLGFEELNAIGATVGHGGVIGFDERTSIPQLVEHIFAFGAEESCGKCTPCRLGSRRVLQLLTSRAGAPGTATDRQTEWNHLIRLLRLGSLCGHGRGLAEFAASINRHYGEELRAWLG